MGGLLGLGLGFSLMSAIELLYFICIRCCLCRKRSRAEDLPPLGVPHSNEAFSAVDLNAPELTDSSKTFPLWWASPSSKDIFLPIEDWTSSVHYKLPLKTIDATEWFRTHVTHENSFGSLTKWNQRMRIFVYNLRFTFLKWVASEISIMN